MTVADIIDALISDRPYKKGWTVDEAWNEIVSNSGTALIPLL